MLVFVISGIDLAEVFEQVKRVGFSGMLVLLVMYFGAFGMGTVTWQMAMVGVPLNGLWLYRTWKLRMVTEVFNTVLPAAGIGGEPLKAELLKKHYGIGYRAGLASIILGKTVELLALVAFLMIGFYLMWQSHALSDTYELMAAIGLAGFAISIILFFVVQRYRIASVAGTWLARFKFARKIDEVLHHIHDMDEALVTFYTRHGWRFFGGFAAAFADWLFGVAEIYYAMQFLGHPVSLSEAWIIEAAAQLVRNGTFFIPASIGAQEGVFLIVCTAITGSPSLGIAMAVVRRFREILWLLWGSAMGLLAFRKVPPPPAP